jgi:hypothetical protein
MTQQCTNFWLRQSDAFRLSFATGMGCVGAAGAMALFSSSTEALRAAQGMALVGVFYFVVAAGGVQFRSRTPALEQLALRLPNRCSSPLYRNANRASSGGWEHN